MQFLMKIIDFVGAVIPQFWRRATWCSPPHPARSYVQPEPSEHCEGRRCAATCGDPWLGHTDSDAKINGETIVFGPKYGGVPVTFPSNQSWDKYIYIYINNIWSFCQASTEVKRDLYSNSCCETEIMPELLWHCDERSKKTSQGFLKWWYP